MYSCACSGSCFHSLSGPFSDSGTNQGERGSAPEVLLEERKECVKVVRREWKAALKFIARVEGEAVEGETAAA